MTLGSAISAALLTTALGLAAAGPAAAQQPAAPAAPAASAPLPIMQPQPTTVPGRPDIPNAEVATQLRGIPHLPFAAAEDKLPISRLIYDPNLAAR